MPTRAQAPAVPHLTYLRIKNYRVLRDVEFRDLTPLTVLIGPNGFLNPAHTRSTGAGTPRRDVT